MIAEVLADPDLLVDAVVNDARFVDAGSFLFLRKWVIGTTPNFCSSMSPMTLRLLPVSGSELRREEKLETV